MKIAGHSGNKVTLSNEIAAVIRKEGHNKRLLAQFDKQLGYQAFDDNVPFKVPKIINTYSNEVGAEYGALMEYVSDSITIIEYIEKTNGFGLRALCDKLIATIRYFCDRSEDHIDITDAFNTKLDSVLTIIEGVHSDTVTLVKDYFLVNEQKRIIVPVGKCHGDLTFSNVLINQYNLELWLIDFLDNFVETPLQDMVKLRQDTKYGWSLLMCNFQFDVTKVKIGLKYLDKLLDKHFSNHYQCYRDSYVPFQILNFLRIIPYATDENTIQFLKKSIRDMIICSQSSSRRQDNQHDLERHDQNGY
jgi:hypothetical protein